MVSTHDAMKKAWGGTGVSSTILTANRSRSWEARPGLSARDGRAISALSQARASTGYVSDSPIGSMKILANDDELHLEATYEAA